MSAEHSTTMSFLNLQRLLRKEVLPLGQIEMGYVMGETVDNQRQSLEQAAFLLKQGVIKKIATPDPHPPYIYGYPGSNYCTQILISLGVVNNQIIKVSSDTHYPQMNTQTELNMFADYLQKQDDTSNIIIIAPWFHALRSYITALSEFKNTNLDRRVFISSVYLNPYKKITHSQGIQKGTRRKIFHEEVEKCTSYKNLISIEEALEIYKRHSNIDNQA